VRNELERANAMSRIGKADGMSFTVEGKGMLLMVCQGVSKSRLLLECWWLSCLIVTHRPWVNGCVSLTLSIEGLHPPGIHAGESVPLKDFDEIVFQSF